MDYLRTANTHPDFITLTQQLDNELASRYGALQKQYDGHNVIAPIETAIALYTKVGYSNIPNYGVYMGMKNSVCMHKILRKADG